MKSKRTNLIVLIIIGSFVLFRLINPPAPDDTTGNIILNVAIELFGGVLLYSIVYLASNLRRIWLFILTKTWFARNDIRISIAYVYRIKVNDKYLLVKNRNRGYYQPVGGVFKTLPGAERIFEKLKVRSDRIFETSKGIAKGDLRVFVRGMNVLEFIDWFNSKKDREIGPWREFVEELITPEFLPWKEFRYFDYKYKGTVQTPIIKLDSGERGMFIYEVYDLIPNNEQKAILNRLYEEGDKSGLIWASDYLIERLGHDESLKKYIYEIAPHTKWAANLKWSKSS